MKGKGNRRKKDGPVTLPGKKSFPAIIKRDTRTEK